MSKIGKKPILIPGEVEVKNTDGVLEFTSKDKKHIIRLSILPYIKVNIENNKLTFDVINDSIQARANHGTIRSLSQNAVIGLKEGFKKVLEFSGVGFKANVEGKTLVLNIGFSHPVKFLIPEEINVVVDDKINTITISGVNKSLVGEVAAKIRALKKPNPYRATGIKYKDEIIKKKAGKKASSTVIGVA